MQQEYSESVRYKRESRLVESGADCRRSAAAEPIGGNADPFSALRITRGRLCPKRSGTAYKNAFAPIQARIFCFKIVFG